MSSPFTKVGIPGTVIVQEILVGTGAFGAGAFGAGPFGTGGSDVVILNIISNVQPVWTVVPTIHANFVPVTLLGAGADQEIGYGMEGYGEAGYDAPMPVVGASSQPLWTVVSVR